MNNRKNSTIHLTQGFLGNALGKTPKGKPTKERFIMSS
jgi:hypothetical protein